jgi:ankyrin repeat protein
MKKGNAVLKERTAAVPSRSSNNCSTALGAFYSLAVLGRAAAEDSRGPLLLVTLALLVLPFAANAATNELTGIMQQALFEEEGNHNLSAAIEGYQNIITRFDESRALTATAVFRLGECYRKQNKTNEAVAQYQRIIRDFGDQTTLVSLSQQNLSGLIGQAGAPMLKTPPGDSALSSAPAISSPTIEEEEIKRIRTMTKDSPDLINARDGNGETPLHRAIKQSQPQVIAFLLSNGADIEARDNNRRTALHAAAEAGNRGAVELLLSKNADARVTDHDGWTPLHFAAQKGFRAIAELLLDHGADINAQDSAGATPLHQAVANSYRAVTELLLSRRASVAVNGRVSSPGFNNALTGTPLHIAVGRGDESTAKLLLAAKAPVEATNVKGETALDNAAAAANTNLVKLLLDNGANPNSKNPRYFGYETWGPLHYAASAGQKGSMALLLAHKADPNAKISGWNLAGNQQKKDFTPLLMSATKGDGEAVELLLANGADPNLTGANGETPLLSLIGTRNASGQEQLQAIKALLDHGADPNASSGNNFTPLMKAASDLQKDIVKLLIDHKADLNARTADHGMTALNLIVQRRDKNTEVISIAQMLLAAGADVNLPSAYQMTPLSYVTSSPDVYWASMAELLRKYGGVTHVPDFNSLRLRREGGDTVAVFRQDTNKVNHFTLFQVIAQYYNNPGSSRSQAGTVGMPPGGLFPFPDLSQLKIVRPVQGSLTETEDSPAYVLNDQNGFDCSKDKPLQFGDVIEIPAREHALTEAEIGLTKVQSDTLRSCLTQKLTFKAKSGTIEFPGVSFGYDNFLSGAMKRPQVQSLLTSASDLRRVKVKRTDPKTHATRELVADVQAFWENKMRSADDIWLRDGDVIEVPDK